MEISVQQQFYEAFKKAVKKRTTEKFAVPLSGGLDSTLITKALYDNGDIDKAVFITFGKDEYVEAVENAFGIKTIACEYPEPTDSERENVVYILEEPFYSHSVNYYLYKKINELGLRVSLSGLGADELFGGYDYYGTDKYPRGLFVERTAITDAEKKHYDIDFLIHHHLRENEKIGLFWSVEGRFPFLDKEVALFNDVGKSLIKTALLQNFQPSFVYRKKTGFRIDNNKKKEHQQQEYLKQLDIWQRTF